MSYPRPASDLAAGSTAYYVVRFARPEHRHTLADLFHWRHELQRTVRGSAEPAVAQAKLQWWREEWIRAARGEASHPLACALAPAVQSQLLEQSALQDMLEAAAQTVARQPIANWDEFVARCDRSGGAFARLLDGAAGYADRDSLLRGRVAKGIELLRDLGSELRRGGCSLPRDALQQAGLSPRELRQPAARKAAAKLLQELSDQLLSTYPRRELLGPSGRWLGLCLPLLNELRRSDFAVWQQRISIPPMRKLWRAWRLRDR